MAKLSLKIKTSRRWDEYAKALAAGKKMKFSTRLYHRCRLCGRNHGYMRKFDICRICFRELARQGLIMGVRKSSW